MKDSPDMSPLGQALQRRVLLCMGPGGVGKTTVAASLGLRASELGRRVVVVTIDPSRRLAQALGFSGPDDAGTIVTVPGTSGSGPPLDCLVLDTRSVFDEIVRTHSSSADAASRMISNPIYEATVARLGGALEYAAIAQVHMLMRDATYDLIVLDTPPTANAIDFLDAPGRIEEVLENPAARFLASSTRVGTRFLGLASAVMLRAFESLGGGPFIGRLGAFLADFGHVLQEFQHRAGGVADLLTSAQTGVVVATAATEFSTREAHGLVTDLRHRGLRIDGVVFNRVDPILPDSPDLSRLEGALEGHDAPIDAPELARLVADQYEVLRSHVERSIRARTRFEQAFSDLSVRTLQRREPPPAGLADLRSMGRELCGATSART